MVKWQHPYADNRKLKAEIMPFGGNLKCRFQLNLLDYLWTCSVKLKAWVRLFDCKASEQQQHEARLKTCLCACSGMNGWVYEHRFTSVWGVHNTTGLRVGDLTALTEQRRQTGWSCWLRWKIYSAMSWDQGSIALAELTLLLEICFFFPVVSTELPEQIQTVGSIVEQTGEACDTNEELPPQHLEETGSQVISIPLVSLGVPSLSSCSFLWAECGSQSCKELLFWAAIPRPRTPGMHTEGSRDRLEQTAKLHPTLCPAAEELIKCRAPQ